MKEAAKHQLTDIATAVEEFVNEMEAVRELLDNTSKSIVPLDDQDRAFREYLAEALPQTTEAQRQQALQRWRTVTDKLSEVNKRNSVDDETEEDRRKGLEAIQAAAPEIDEILSHRRGFMYVIAAWRDSVDKPRRTPLLRSALLTTAVSGFEVLVSKLARGVIALRPEVLRGSESKYSMAEIEGFTDLAEFRDHCADRYVDSIMFGGLDDWTLWLKKQLKIEWNDFTSDPDRFREIFQRRHLVVHNGGVVNRQYLLRMANSSNLPEIGTRLVVSRGYCETAIDLLVQAGVRLGSRIIRKLDKSAEQVGRPADQLCSTIAFRLLKKDQNTCVIDILDNELSLCTDDETTQVMRVNLWIARKALGGLVAIEEEADAWQAHVLAPRYQLAKFALLERNDEALELGIDLRAKGEVSIEDWLTWPLLRGVREHELSEMENATTNDESSTEVQNGHSE